MREDAASFSNRKIVTRRKRSSAAPVFGLWLFLLFCSIMAAYFFIHSPYFNIQTMKVTGNHTLSSEEVTKLSGLMTGINIFQADAAGAILKIELNPNVKDATIKRRLPSTLLFQITERVPEALIVGQGGFILVDNESVYLQKIQDLQDQKLPIISGITVADSQKPGTIIDKEGLTTALKLIALLDKSFLQNVVEINAPSSLSLSLKTIQGVEVRFGQPIDLERKISLMESLLFKNGAVINSDTVE